VSKKNQLKSFEVLASPTLSYSLESRILRKYGETKIKTAEIKFLLALKILCTREDIKSNEEIGEELHIFTV
jgi:hypothetical protein